MRRSAILTRTDPVFAAIDTFASRIFRHVRTTTKIWQAKTLPSFSSHCSPDPQVFGPNGELFVLTPQKRSSQTQEAKRLMTRAQASAARIIRHGCGGPGD